MVRRVVQPDVLEVVVARLPGVLVCRGLKDRHADRSLDSRLGLTGMDELGVETVAAVHGALLAAILHFSSPGDQLAVAIPAVLAGVRSPQGLLAAADWPCRLRIAAIGSDHART